MTSGVLLRAEQISYQVPQKVLLYPLNVHLKRQQLFGILGPNGAGKTTLLRLLAGTLLPSTGHIDLDGQPLTQWPRIRLAQWVAMVSPRESRPVFAMSVNQYVQLGRTPYQNWLGSANQKDLAICTDVIQACGLAHLQSQAVQQLSSGEWQKAQLARALAQQPHVLFLDEPTSHLDLNAQLSLLTLLQAAVQEQQLTIAMVLHDLNLASYFCDQVLLLQQGKRVGQGPPADVLQSDCIEQVYGSGWEVQYNTTTGKPVVFPVGIRSKETCETN